MQVRNTDPESMRRSLIFLLLLSATTLWRSASAQTTMEVLVNSRGTNAVLRYDLSGTFLGEFIAAGSGGLIGPEDILFHPDGTVLVTGFGNAAIKRYDGTTGAYIGDFSSGYALATPSKMSIGPDDLIYVTQWGTTQNKVVRFGLDGVFVDEFTSIGTPNGLGHFWDDQGRFYISVYGNGASGYVRRFEADGNDLGVFIDSSILQGPTGLLRLANGHVLVQDWTTGTVQHFDENGIHVGVFVSGLTNPEGIALLPTGEMLMGDWGVDAVHIIDFIGNNLGYFCSGNGLTDPNCVRVREVAAIGVEEVGAEPSGLQIVPSIGPGPFELRVTSALDPSATVTVIDATGRIIAEFSWTAGARAVPFRVPSQPKKPVTAGRYMVVVRNQQMLMRATVTITE